MRKQKKWYQHNSIQVLLAGFISFVLATIFLKPSFYKALLGLEHVNLIDIDLSENRMVWTLITAIVSAPVAFAIWRLRDKNVSEQIENARKDTNLKEFQKLAEWVSGAHFIEEKVSVKTKYEEAENLEKKVIEETREYTVPSNELAIQTYSKMDGAVGLQIAAVYNLLPFYRGDHGESFKKPALNLLTSAWLALQRKELTILEKKDLSEDEQAKSIKKLKDNAKSPLGIAITRVLLSLNNQNVTCLTEHKEIFIGLCLAGMNFHISGVDKACLSIFKHSNCYGINMIGANLEKADLTRANLNGANLEMTNFMWANLEGVNLREANLQRANLKSTNLREAHVQEGNLQGAEIQRADLQRANFLRANLRDVSFLRANLKGANLREAVLINTYWQDAELDENLRKKLEEYGRIH